MSRKFRRFYETAFDSKISKSDEDLLSADKQDAAIADRMSSQLQLSASASSIRDPRRGGGGGVGCPTAAVRAPSSSGTPCKNRLFGFLRQLQPQQKRRKYLSSDLSAATSSSVSLESITSDSLSSHSSESPCYRPRFQEPHVLSPISDKSLLQDGGGTDVPPHDAPREREGLTATAGQTARTCKPPQSLGVIKLNGDHRQHHGSDSGISVGSKPGDSYQELSDVPFDMPKLRRKQRSDVWRSAENAVVVAAPSEDRPPAPPPEPLPFDMPKLRRRQLTSAEPAVDAAPLPFDMPKLKRRQTDCCGGPRVASLDFDLQGFDSATAVVCTDGKRGLSFDGTAKRPDRSSMFLDVTPNSLAVAAMDANCKPQLKTFQNKSQTNRPVLSLSNIKPLHFVEDIDITLPLDQQCWYHGPMNRLEAEKILHGQEEGCYLVRGNKGSYALSIKSAKGFIHMRIIQSGEQNYLGQSDRPFDSIPDLIKHYTLNKLPAKGAEHVGLIRPLAQQIL